MTQRIEAIYENGVLRPLQPLRGVADHTRVDVTVNASPDPQHDANMDVRACIGTLSDKDAAEMTKIIENEFEKVDERDW